MQLSYVVPRSEALIVLSALWRMESRRGFWACRVRWAAWCAQQVELASSCPAASGPRCWAVCWHTSCAVRSEHRGAGAGWDVLLLVASHRQALGPFLLLALWALSWQGMVGDVPCMERCAGALAVPGGDPPACTLPELAAERPAAPTHRHRQFVQVADPNKSSLMDACLQLVTQGAGGDTVVPVRFGAAGCSAGWY